MQLQSAVKLDHNGRRFTFWMESDPLPHTVAFWTVESAGRIYRSLLTVSGIEQPAFFRGLADVALREWG